MAEQTLGNMLWGVVSSLGALCRYWWTWAAPATVLTGAVLAAIFGE